METYFGGHDSSYHHVCHHCNSFFHFMCKCPCDFMYQHINKLKSLHGLNRPSLNAKSPSSYPPYLSSYSKSSNWAQWLHYLWDIFLFPNLKIFTCCCLTSAPSPPQLHHSLAKVNNDISIARILSLFNFSVAFYTIDVSFILHFLSYLGSWDGHLLFRILFWYGPLIWCREQLPLPPFQSC